MKTLWILFFNLLLFQGVAQENPEAILGTYLNLNGTAKIEIYKSGNTYEGKIIWLSEPLDKNGNPRTDKNNDNKSLRDRPLLGLVTLKNLQYEDSNWTNGEMYNPERGNSIAFKVVSISDASLIIKISKGFFSKEIILKRV